MEEPRIDNKGKRLLSENGRFSTRDDLGRALIRTCLLHGEFRLRSGRTSAEYFDKYRSLSSMMKAMDKRIPEPPVWDAADYAKNSQGQYGWAMNNLARLALVGHEAVLDVGCGDGKVTAEIARRVRQGHVVGIDRSEAMIALARKSFNLPNLEFRALDGQMLDYKEEFDAVFSNSAIHWMPDPRATVEGIARALKPGGRVFLSMGGRGTASAGTKALEELAAEPRWNSALAEAASPHYFLGPQEYLPWLSADGLQADRVELVPKPMRLANVGALEGWLRTTWMTYCQRIPVERRTDFLREFTDRVRSRCETTANGELLMPMVNLEIEAHKDHP